MTIQTTSQCLRAEAQVMGGAAAASASGASAPAAAPILAGSKSLGKRKREEAEEERTNRAARQLRAEMRRRGHVVRPRFLSLVVPVQWYYHHQGSWLKPKCSLLDGIARLLGFYSGSWLWLSAAASACWGSRKRSPSVDTCTFMHMCRCNRWPKRRAATRSQTLLRRRL